MIRFLYYKFFFYPQNSRSILLQPFFFLTFTFFSLVFNISPPFVSSLQNCAYSLYSSPTLTNSNTFQLYIIFLSPQPSHNTQTNRECMPYADSWTSRPLTIGHRSPNSITRTKSWTRSPMNWTLLTEDETPTVAICWWTNWGKHKTGYCI
jgi:hypothetical protein